MLKLMLLDYIKSWLVGRQENLIIRFLRRSLAFLGISILLLANYLYFVKLEKDIGMYTAYGTGAIAAAFILQALSCWYLRRKQNPLLTAIGQIREEFSSAVEEKVSEAAALKTLISYLPAILKTLSLGAAFFVSYYVFKKNLLTRIQGHLKG